MQLHLLKSKIHMARLTQADLWYEGSLGVDRDLLDEAGIRPFERILVVNATNGQRLETYAIEAPRGSKTFCLNGAAARRGVKGDMITVMSFAVVEEAEADAHKPIIIVLDENNDIKDRK